MGNQFSTFVVDAYHHIKKKVIETVRAIAPPIVQYIVAHPIQTAFHVVNGVLLLFPGAMTLPLLSVAGWASNGVRAGSLASAIQSTMGGAVAAGGMFATMQSAAMGGYGVAAVSNAVAAGAAGAAGAAVLLSRGKVEEQVMEGDCGVEMSS